MKNQPYRIGREIYCILVSSNRPNTLIPVRGIIKDVKWDRQNPSYLIKIVGFYDTFQYIKNNFFNMTFFKDIEKKREHLELKMRNSKV